MNQRNPMDQDMARCIEACQHCHNTCLQTAMSLCLETGGEHLEPEHFRLMMNCAEICQTAANFMLSASAVHERLCQIGAEVCDACADSCDEIGGMDDCVKACRDCAESCRQMATSGHNMEANASRSVGML